MATRKLWASTPILRQSCGTNVRDGMSLVRWPTRFSLAVSALALALGVPAFAQTKSSRSSTNASGTATKSRSAASRAKAKTHPAPISPKPTVTGADEQELERLARPLHEKPTAALATQLTAFSERHGKTALGARAALALAYYQFTRNNYSEARDWLEKASSDPLLADYVLFWKGTVDRASGANQAAYNEFTQFRSMYPNSVVSDQAVDGMARAALALNQPDDAVAALDGYARTTTKSSLVLLRAQAREKSSDTKGQMPFAATTDYLDVMYRFPLSDDAKTAAARIPYLQAELGEQYPGVPLSTEITRAEALYNARRWSDLRTAYRALTAKLSGSARDRATLRLAQADAQLGGGPAALASATVTDPDVDAEMLYVLSQAYRSAQGRVLCCGKSNPSPEMFQVIEQLATKYPHSPWTAEGLYAAGNSYWATLDRDHAVEFYQRMLAAFPTGPNANIASWRIAWTAYMERRPETESLLEQFVRQFPISGFAVDALYWLGRLNERNGKRERATTFYSEAQQRFPQTYFGHLAAERRHGLGELAAEPVEFLSQIPAASPLDSLGGPLPAAAHDVWLKAQALESIGFDSSAELELRAAYTATRAPQLLMAAAEAAASAGQYAVGIVAARQLVPQLEARKFDEVPMDVWRIAYPMPFRDAVEREALRSKLDPMLVAGLIRQESAFNHEAVSSMAAVGLMQLEPSTGARLARSLRLGYSRSRLFDPDYNVRLGTVYLAGLLESYMTPEAALAAYNAGEDRVAEWTMGQNYEETAEFVESIPFTETREYVQIVLRNAELYRETYASHTASEPKPPATRHG
jgi:soluble lytic murein transglycosylase